MKRIFLWLIIAALISWHAATLRGAVVKGYVPLFDFIEYWSSCRILLDGGNPYGEDELLRVQRSLGWTDQYPVVMWNPPWTLAFLLPFAYLPFWTARGVWFLLELIVIILAADWLWDFYGGPVAHRWIAWLSGVLFLPSLMALYLGQISPFLLAGLVGFIFSVQRKNYPLAGVWLVMIAIKPHAVYLIWPFVLLWIWRERRWSVLGGAVVCFIALTLPVLMLNPFVIGQYLRVISKGAGPLIWATPTLGVATQLLLATRHPFWRFLPTAAGIVAAIVLWMKWRRNFNWSEHLLPIVLLSVITSSFTWTFDWIVLLPAVILMMVWFQESPLQRWWLLAALLLSQVVIILIHVLVSGSTDMSNFWLPLVLWLLYVSGRRFSTLPGNQSAEVGAR